MMSTVASDRQAVGLAAQLRMAIGPLERQLRRQGTDPFTPTQLSVIGAIYRHGPIALGDLAARERLSAPMISKVVASLDKAGVVRRIPDEGDRRVCRVAIATAGERWIEEGQARRNAWQIGRAHV